jgi:hypothetical protein
MEDWSRRVRASLERPGTDEERARQFTAEVMDDLARATSRRRPRRTPGRTVRFVVDWTGEVLAARPGRNA